MPLVHPIPIHPAALAMPELSAGEYEALKADIQANGLQSRITLYDDQVIDGRHRYRVLRELGAEDEDYYDDIDLGDQSPEEWVWSINGLRRHLRQSQRAALAWELLGASAIERAKQRQRKSLRVAQKCATLDARTSQDIARMAGVSPRLVDYAKAIHEWSPDIFAQVKCGLKTLHEAYQAIREERDRTHQQLGLPVPEDSAEEQKIATEPPATPKVAADPPAKRPVADQSPPKPTKPSTAKPAEPLGISEEFDHQTAAEAVISLRGRGVLLPTLRSIVDGLTDTEKLTLYGWLQDRVEALEP